MTQETRRATTRGNAARIRPLSELTEVEPAEDQPDVRGWSVRAMDGETIGSVKELLVDREAMRVSLLEVALSQDSGGGNPGGEEEFLRVPVGAATLNRKGEEVHLPMTAREAAGQLPWRGGDPVPEHAVATSLRRESDANRLRIRMVSRPPRARRQG